MSMVNIEIDMCTHFGDRTMSPMIRYPVLYILSEAGGPQYVKKCIFSFKIWVQKMLLSEKTDVVLNCAKLN